MLPLPFAIRIRWDGGGAKRAAPQMPPKSGKKKEERPSSSPTNQQHLNLHQKDLLLIKSKT